tara:strand:+ start:1861 stop:2154 length:294 start_codon:yes stop_codon:yes gene_type:complete
MKDLDHYLQEAIKNINEDRDVTKSLLRDVMELLASNDMHHKEIGLIAAKYVETLQRSNEQLVKISALLQKSANKTVGLSADDKKDLYDLIQGETEEQ